MTSCVWIIFLFIGIFCSAYSIHTKLYTYSVYIRRLGDRMRTFDFVVVENFHTQYITMYNWRQWQHLRLTSPAKIVIIRTWIVADSNFIIVTCHFSLSETCSRALVQFHLLCLCLKSKKKILIRNSQQSVHGAQTYTQPVGAVPTVDVSTMLKLKKLQCVNISTHTCAFVGFARVVYVKRNDAVECELYYYYFPFDFSECFTFERQFAYLWKSKKGKERKRKKKSTTLTKEKICIIIWCEKRKSRQEKHSSSK